MINNRIIYRKIRAEINIVPLLDILLILVLIFMATSSNFTQSINVNLPESDNTSINSYDHNSLVIIEIPQKGRYNLIVNDDRMECLFENQILSEINTRIIANSKTVFLIGGAKDLPYNEIVNTLKLLHKAGIKSVGLMTHPI